MSLGIQNRFQINVTLVADEFIDQYMASANGEYVKVYLYILRHEKEAVDISSIADALYHTEADVKRAIAYWEKLGILKSNLTAEASGSVGRFQADRNHEKPPLPASVPFTETGMVKEPDAPVKPAARYSQKSRMDMPVQQAEPAKDLSEYSSQDTVQTLEELPQKKSYSPYQLTQLSGNEEFAQLLYVAQKYTGTIFNHRECEIFAYLYEDLKMPFDLLVHLVATCVQAEHKEVRYMEAVAINWHKAGVKTVDQAKEGTALYVKGYSCVMKAFGLTGRKPGIEEHDYIRTWFYTYLFSPEIVVEACNRTMRALHQPSFEYANKILKAWKEAGVRRLDDIKELDYARENDRKKVEEGKKRQPAPVRADKNQFHNFRQRDTDYNALVMERLKERLGQQADLQ